MKATLAAVLRTPDKPYVLENITLADLQPHEVLVKVVGAGMCHTDLQPRNPDQQFTQLPIVLGHEGSGIVEDVGSAVTGIKVGDHVLMSFMSCGVCASCRSGSPAYCAEFETGNLTGRNADGSTGAVDVSGSEIANRWFAQSSFAQHSVANDRNVVVVDQDLPLELLGPLGCGLQTGAGAVLNEMRVAPGQSIAVFGAGAVGLGAVMAAKLAGATDIVAVDIQPSRLELALELGANRAVLATKGDVVAQVRGVGAGMDFSFDTTSVTEVISSAIAVLGRPGKAVLVGGGSGALTVTPYELAGKYVTFVFEGSAIPQLFLPKLIDFWRQGRFPFDKLVRTYPLDEIGAAEDDTVSGKTVKPVILPH